MAFYQDNMIDMASDLHATKVLQEERIVNLEAGISSIVPYKKNTDRRYAYQYPTEILEQTRQYNFWCVDENTHANLGRENTLRQLTQTPNRVLMSPFMFLVCVFFRHTVSSLRMGLRASSPVELKKLGHFCLTPFRNLFWTFWTYNLHRLMYTWQIKSWCAP